MRQITAAISFLLLAPLVRSDEQSDPVQAALDKAWTTYQDEVVKADRLMIESSAKLEKAARQKGDKATLDRLNLEWVDYQLTGRTTKSTPATVRQKLSLAHRDLVAAYVQSVKAYTKASKDDKATAAQKVLDELRNSAPTRYFSLLNEKSGLVLTPEKENAERAVVLVQTKDTGALHQQWSFQPHNQPGVYLIRNRLSGHFLNIAGTHDFGRTHLWSFDAAEHNHWLISRDDKFLRIRDANGEGYLTPEGASKEKDVPILKSAKVEGIEQLWRLLPVNRK